MGSFSIWHWLIVLVIVMLVFGTKKLGNMGADLGRAVKGFKDGVKAGEETTDVSATNDTSTGNPSHQKNQVTHDHHDHTIDVVANEKSKSS